MDDKTRRVVFETNGKTYKELYDNIIEENLRNPPPEGENTIEHHIRPKSIFPDLMYLRENLVRLTEKVHLLVHYLLWQHYKRETDDRDSETKMCAAFWQMVNTIEWRGEAELEWLSERYEEARVDFSKTMSGESNPMKRPEVKEKHLEAMRRPEVREKRMGENNPMRRPEVREKFTGENNPMMRPEVRERHLEAMRRPEVREKFKKFTGENNPMKRPEVREKRSKKVVQCSPDGTFISEYSSMTEAALKTNSDVSQISKCCRGRHKTHNGFVWRLAADSVGEVSHG